MSKEETLALMQISAQLMTNPALCSEIKTDFANKSQSEQEKARFKAVFEFVKKEYLAQRARLMESSDRPPQDPMPVVPAITKPR